MSDKFQPVQSNQRVAIPAGTWNAMLEAAKTHELAKFNVGTGNDPLVRQGDICRVLNESGTDQERFAVVGVTAPLISPVDNLKEFQTRAAFRVGVPSGTSKGRFGILLEPIPAGRIGRAWFSGVCPARVMVVEAEHGYCEAAEGATGALKSDCFGSARILWREPGLGLKWALVRLGNRDDNGRHFRFELLASLAGGAAAAALFTMEGESVEDDIVRDPEGIFARLEEGDRGLVVKQCGKFWVIQARCPIGQGDN